MSLHAPQGQERLDEFCAVLRQIGRALHKPVVLLAEGSGESSILTCEPAPDSVVFQAGPWHP